MESNVGYVLVSKTMRNIRQDCENCKTHPSGQCPIPERPRCHAACLPTPRLLELPPECQEWQRQYEAWYEVHNSQECTGGTRLGPLHYFSDCFTLLKRGPRRADAKIIALDYGTASALDLPICKECKSKMAPFERQLPQREVEHQPDAKA